MGPTLNNLEQLVRMPYGCGEQNAASTAPNIFVRQYLDKTQQLTFKLKEKTNKYMMTGAATAIYSQVLGVQFRFYLYCRIST